MYAEGVDSLRTQLHGQGFTVIPDLLKANEVGVVARGLDVQLAKNAGTRRLLDAPWCRALARRIADDPRLRALLPGGARAVQCTFFTKSVEYNWLVSLHQDLSIPVAERVDSANCSGWSQKEGELFVQPPISVLEETLAVRLHLDDCNERNGALRVVPQSHRFGRLSSSSALLERDKLGEVVVSVSRGGAMLMRPLLLHASSKASVDAPRRVMHFVYGPTKLPEGLRWPSRRRSYRRDS